MGWLSYERAPEEDMFRCVPGRLGFHPWQQMVLPGERRVESAAAHASHPLRPAPESASVVRRRGMTRFDARTARPFAPSLLETDTADHAGH